MHSLHVWLAVVLALYSYSYVRVVVTPQLVCWFPVTWDPGDVAGPFCQDRFLMHGLLCPRCVLLERLASTYP